MRSRRGGGVFSFLSGLAKKAFPFLVRSVAPEVVNMGRSVLGDVLEGRKVKTALRTRGVEALRGVGQRLARGGGRTSGKKKRKNKRVGVRRKTKRKQKKGRCYKNDVFNMNTLV